MTDFIKKGDRVRYKKSCVLSGSNDIENSGIVVCDVSDDEQVRVLFDDGMCSWVNRNMLEILDDPIALNAEAKEARAAEAIRRATEVTHRVLETPHSAHYRDTKIEPWDVIDDWQLDYYAGNILKYIKRLGRKQGETPTKDAEKIVAYATKLLERTKANAR